MKIYALIFALLSPLLCRAAVIQGNLPDAQHTVVTISECTDFITPVYTDLKKFTCDQQGYFKADITCKTDKKIKLVIGMQTVTFYACGTSVYDISRKDGKLVVAHPANDRNAMKEAIDGKLFKWYMMWIDSSGSFKSPYSYHEVMGRLGEIKTDIISAFPPYKKIEEQYLGLTEMNYTVWCFSKVNKDSANMLLNKIEARYLSQKQYDLHSEYFLGMLKTYLEMRINNSRVTRVKNEKKNQFSRVMQETHFFAGKEMREIAAVMAVKLFYENKWYRDDTDIDGFNAQVKDTAGRMSPPMRETVLRLVERFNSLKEGDVFPDLPLKNELDELVDIKDIVAPFILVDFWATWCEPCKEGMKKFPALIDKYKGKLMIVSISIDKDIDQMREYLTANSYTGKWRTLYNGPEGNYLSKFPISGVPTYMLLDKDKKVLKITSGIHFDDITAILDASPDSSSSSEMK